MGLSFVASWLLYVLSTLMTTYDRDEYKTTFSKCWMLVFESISGEMITYSL